MTGSSRLSWIRLSGVLAVGLLIFASLMMPMAWEGLRSGHWAVEHFAAYFATTLILCRGWSRPFLVMGFLLILAMLLEALQCLNPDHTPNIFAALSSIGGAMVAAPLAISLFRPSEIRPVTMPSRRSTNRK